MAVDSISMESLNRIFLGDEAWLTLIVLLTYIAVLVTGFAWRTFAPMGLLLYSAKPAVDLGYSFRFGILNLQGVAIVAFLCGLVLFSIIRYDARERAATYSATLLASVYFASALLSTLLFGHLTLAIPDLLRAGILIPIVFAGHAYFYMEKGRTTRFFVYILVLDLVAVIGYLQLSGIAPYTYHTYVEGTRIDRVTAGYYHPTGWNNFALFGVAFVVYILEATKSKAIKTFALASLLWWMPIVYLSILRSAYVSIALLIATYLILARRLALLLTLFIPAVLVFFLSSDFIVDTIERTMRALDTENYDNLLNRRVELWSELTGIIAGGSAINWLIGFGAYPIIDGVVVNDAHNDYLKVMFEAGLLGTIAYLGLVLLSVHHCWLQHQRGVNHEQRTLARLCIALFVAVAFYSISVRPTDYPTVMLFLFSLASYMIVSNHQPRNA